MSKRYKEMEHHHAGRRHGPHCRTCICHMEDTKAPITLDCISSPKLKSYRERYFDRNHNSCRNCHQSPSGDWKTRDVCREQRYKSVSTSTKIERKIHSDHKFSVLESWFKKYDFDGNGLIDVYELKSLLNDLGIGCEKECIEEMIEKIDRDGDGMLSFSDFLHMWSQAAHGDGLDLDLSDILKEHDLYPDILPPQGRHMPKHTKNLHVKESSTRKYEPRHEFSCCETAPLRKIVKTYPKETELKIKSSVYQSESRCSDELPVLSCHR